MRCSGYMILYNQLVMAVLGPERVITFGCGLNTMVLMVESVQFYRYSSMASHGLFGWEHLSLSIPRTRVRSSVQK